MNLINTRDNFQEHVYILPDYDGGVASVVKNLIKFRKSSIFTKVILLHSIDNKNSIRIKNVPNCDKIVRIEYDVIRGSKRNLCKKIAQNLAPGSVIISNDGGIEFEMIKICKLNNPVIYILHGNTKHYFNAIHTHSDVIDKIITVSDFLAKKTNELFKEKENQPEIVSLKFPVQNIKQNRNPSELLRLCFVGSLIESKGVDTFKVIVDILKENRVKYSFNIIGDGKKRKELTEIFQGHENIRFHGWLPQSRVIELHQNHDILVLPSFSEGLPVSVIEGMKAGVIPIVSNLESGIPEIVKNNFTGFTAPIGDARGFAEAILKLNHDRELINLLRRNCVQFSNEHFDPMIQAQLYEKHYTIRDQQRKIKNLSIKERVINSLPGGIAFQLKKRLNFNVKFFS